MKLLKSITKIALVLTLSATGLSARESLIFDNTWVRLTPPVSANSAGYFTLTNQSEKDISIKSIATEVSNKAELHDMTMVNGAMGMVHMPNFTIKAKETVEFMPAGKHLMLLGLKKPLKLNQVINVSFTLNDESTQSVAFTVKRKAEGNVEGKAKKTGGHKHH